jgi:anti-sigma regulatory factor (Ser/Thr protein kinase)
VLCLFDLGGLSQDLIGDVERTHPVVISAGQPRVSPAYLGPGTMPPGCDDPLSPPGPGADSLNFADQLSSVRDFSAAHASRAGLSSVRARDLTLAVSEIAANSFGHAGGGVVRAWCTESEVICQIEDSGHIRDPLAGRRQRPPDSAGGHGLWLVNRLCDLVERRTGPGGTVTRLHMRRPG